MSELLPSGKPSLQFDPGSKMQVKGIGDLMHPGCCMTCGNGNCDEGYLDLGTYFDYEGQMYLCIPCVNEVAESAGLLNATEIEFLQNQNKEIAAKLAEITKAYEAANERLEHFNSLLDVKFDSHPDLSLAEQQRRTEKRESTTESVTEVGREQPDLFESTTDEGLSESSGTESSNTGGIDL